MATSPKTSYLLTFRSTSPRLTAEMMERVGIRVDEIISTVDQSQSIQYTYIHLKRKKIREEKIKDAMQALAATHGLQEYNINGHSFITGNFVDIAQHLENHPGFQLLVAHEESGNCNFSKWVDPTCLSKQTIGYNLLKSKMDIAEITSKGIYVLRIDNRPKPFFYVGKANDIERRIQQHSDGTGAYCITGEPFTRVETVTKGTLLCFLKYFII